LLRTLWLFAATLSAHDLGVTGLQIEVAEGKTIVRVQAHESRIPPSEDPGKYIASKLKLRLDGAPFQAAAPKVTKEQGSDVFLWEAERSGEPTEIIVDAAVFPDVKPDKTVVTLVRNGASAGEGILPAESGPVVIQETSGGALRRFIPIGVEHIWFGADHIAFLLALILPGGRLRSLLTVITAFTIAHSITLAVAVLGYVRPLPWLVEGVIALSIVAAAGENLLSKGDNRARIRALYAAGFGLVHGFGFAGALAEVGLPKPVLGWALAGFNLGVEFGQFVIVLIVLPILARIPRRDLVVRYASILIMAVGLYWTIDRLFFS
jgi:hypothetical protein